MNKKEFIINYLEENNGLPILSATVMKLMETLDSPDYSLSDIANIILGDPVLTLKVLRLANSSMVGTRNKIETITDAVVLLGTDIIKSIVLGVEILHLFQFISTNKETLEKIHLILQRSLFSAVIAKLISETNNNISSEKAFISALLHDIGSILILIFTEKYNGDKIIHHSENYKELFIEKELIYHYDLWALLAKKWNLPKYLYNVIFHLHLPNEAIKKMVASKKITHEEEELINLVKYSTHLSEYFSIFNILENEQINSSEFKDNIKLSEVDIKNIISKAPDMLHDFGTIFNVKFDNKSIVETLEIANKELSKINLKYGSININLTKKLSDSQKLYELVSNIINCTSRESIIKFFLDFLFNLLQERCNYYLVSYNQNESSLDFISYDNIKKEFKNYNITFNNNEISTLASIVNGRQIFGINLNDYPFISNLLNKTALDFSENISIFSVIYDENEKLFLIIDENLENLSNDLQCIISTSIKNINQAFTNIRLLETLERKHNELEIAHKELLEMQETMIAAEKDLAIASIIGHIAHDINNLITPILGRTQLLKYFVKEEKILQNLDVIEKSTVKAADIIKNLLRYARQDFELKDKISLKTSIKNAYMFLAHRMEKINITFTEIYEPEDKDFIIYANEGQIMQCFLNLLTNAYEAIPPDSNGNIEIKVIEKEDCYDITIKDNGIGIKPEYLNKIYQPFFTTKVKKRGLGLSAAYGIIKQYGGNIEINNNQDTSGVTVSIILYKNID